MSVNGKSLEQITHDKAAAILKNASGDVQLVVSQFSNAGTSFLGMYLVPFGKEAPDESIESPDV